MFSLSVFCPVCVRIYLKITNSFLRFGILRTANSLFVNYRRISMFRKSFITFIFVSAIAIGYSSIFAQTAPVSGSVELKKADGTKEPVVGALVEVYRTDIKAGFPSAKTNKRGEFAFAGFPFGGTFTLAISAPGCAPYMFSSVKAGQDK